MARCTSLQQAQINQACGDQYPNLSEIVDELGFLEFDVHDSLPS